MLGQEPPIIRQATTVRWPAFARVQARYLPASPLPMTRDIVFFDLRHSLNPSCCLTFGFPFFLM